MLHIIVQFYILLVFCLMQVLSNHSFSIQIPLLQYINIFLKIIPDNIVICGNSTITLDYMLQPWKQLWNSWPEFKHKTVDLKFLWLRAVKINNDKNGHNKFGKSLCKRSRKMWDWTVLLVIRRINSTDIPIFSKIKWYFLMWFEHLLLFRTSRGYLPIIYWQMSNPIKHKKQKALEKM